MATVLLCSGAKGKRYALPNATVHMHQPLGGAQGQAADIEIAAREILRLQDKIRQIISDHTLQPYEQVAQETRTGTSTWYPRPGYGIRPH